MTQQAVAVTTHQRWAAHSQPGAQTTQVPAPQSEAHPLQVVQTWLLAAAHANACCMCRCAAHWLREGKTANLPAHVTLCLLPTPIAGDRVQAACRSSTLQRPGACHHLGWKGCPSVELPHATLKWQTMEKCLERPVLTRITADTQLTHPSSCSKCSALLLHPLPATRCSAAGARAALLPLQPSVWFD